MRSGTENNFVIMWRTIKTRAFSIFSPMVGSEDRVLKLNVSILSIVFLSCFHSSNQVILPDLKLLFSSHKSRLGLPRRLFAVRLCGLKVESCLVVKSKDLSHSIIFYHSVFRQAARIPFSIFNCREGAWLMKESWRGKKQKKSLVELEPMNNKLAV